MAGLFDAVRNLWVVPEEMEDDHDVPEREKKHSRESSDSRRSRYDDDDYDSYSDERYSESSYSSKQDSSYSSSYSSYDDEYEYDNSYSSESARGSSSPILNINATTRLQVVCIKPVNFNDFAVQIAEELMKSHTVLLNFEETPRDESKRIIDFISGCAYVSDGRVQRIAKNMFIVTPNSVELKGDTLLDELQNKGVQFE